MRPPLYYGWVIVATLFVVNFATHATGTLNLGLFVIPMGDALGISRGLFGWLTTARYLAGGLSAIFLGRLLDRFGPRLLIPASALVTGLCVIGFGMADNVVQLFLLFTVIGLAGLSTPGGGLLSSVPVAKWFVRRRGTAIALASLGLGLGGITLLPITQVLINVVEWRRAWLYLGITSMVLIIPPALIYLRRQPEDLGLRPDGDTGPSTGPDSTEEKEDEEAAWTLKEALHTRAFWLLTTALVLGGFGMGASIHRIPYWVELGFDADLVSLSFSADAAGATVMMLGAGFLLDRFPARFVAAGAYAGFAGALVLMLTASSTFDLFASVVLWGLAIGINIVSQTYLWADYFGRAFLGTIRGITLPTIMLASAFGAPTVGYIFDFSGGYEPAWRALIAVYLLALVIMVTAKPPHRNPRRPAG
ncbi:MAG: MFS transporter [SAR202 cluster bacterium]|jgi:sugar phosphate permease|nr:MFS transporter [SAR202 cluster bacterium]